MTLDNPSQPSDLETFVGEGTDIESIAEQILSPGFFDSGLENAKNALAKVRENKEFFAKFMNLASRIAEVLGQPFEEGDLVAAIKIVKSAKSVLKVNGVRIFADSHMDLETLQTMVAVLESYDPNSLELRRKEVSEG